MRHPLVFDVPRILVPILVLVGIVTAVGNKSFGGFTPMMWLVLALVDLLYIICTEVLTIRSILESRK